MSKPMYRLVDGKGRVLIPKSMREAAKLEYGDIVCLGMAGGKMARNNFNPDSFVFLGAQINCSGVQTITPF